MIVISDVVKIEVGTPKRREPRLFGCFVTSKPPKKDSWLFGREGWEVLEAVASTRHLGNFH